MPTANPAAGLVVLCSALTVVMGAMTSVAVALPDIGRSTGASQSDLTWILDSYTVVFAGLLLPCGALGDRYGRRRMLVVGLMIFAAASVLGPVGDDPTMVIVARAVAGLGAALVMPATLSLITTTMSGHDQQRAVSIWVAVCTLGGALGLVFSGLVLEFADWRALFHVSAGVAVLVAFAAVLVGESSDPARPRFDVAGAVTSAAAVGLVVFGIIEAPAHGWGSPVVWSCVAAGLGFLLVFLALERAREHPLLDIGIFRSPLVLTGSLTLMAVFAVLFAFFFLAMQFLQLIEGRSPLLAGLAVLPAAVTMVPLSLAAPALVARWGLRVVTAVGLLPLVAGLGLFAALQRDEPGTFLAALLLLGTGFGLCITPATLAILRSVPAAKQGVASAVNDAVREVGAALGIAFAGSLVASGYGRNLGPAVDGLPEPARSAAEASFGGALEVGVHLGPAAAPAVAEARAAFLSGLHTTFLAFAAFAVLCLLAVLVAAPGRDRRAEGELPSRIDTDPPHRKY